CVDTARSAAHVSGLAALTRAGFWPALRPHRSRVAACVIPSEMHLRMAWIYVKPKRAPKGAFC
ncbi:hypothetical protein ACTUVK_003108, partial [Stenotrophomonas rhizophila]